ncbi:hypothetical protein CHS0354_003304 [Potamilus streckersoni]|uniref:Peptidoglycan-recognition protein n=1 Tax=Potamilus streckersoni TaxID=2493646 RepID=A0AAE0S4W5_9BIVA|nr:hypothetical protein CHS0354_003304 [Potamilus streckersoni]
MTSNWFKESCLDIDSDFQQTISHVLLQKGLVQSKCQTTAMRFIIEVIVFWTLVQGIGACANVKIVSRSAWGAAAPKSVSNLRLPVSLVFIHHTETPACQTLVSCKTRVQSIQRDHMVSKGWNDIGYSFLVAGDGTIYEGRGWNRVGAHTEGYNQRGIAFSFIGSYSGSKPPTAALTAVKKMIQCGISLKKVASRYRLYGHRDVNPTSCPGNALYREIKTWPHYSRTKP